MYFDTTVIDTLDKAVREVTGEPLLRALLDPAVLARLVAARGEVLKRIPHSHASQARKLLDWVAENAERLRRVADDPEVARLLIKYARCRVLSEGFESEVLLKAWETLVNYVPLRARDLTRDGREVYVLAPPSLEGLEIRTIDAEKVLDQLLRVHVRFRPDGTIEVLGHVLRPPPYRYLAAMEAYAPDLFAKYLRQQVDGIISAKQFLKPHIKSVEGGNPLIVRLGQEAVIDYARHSNLPLPSDYKGDGSITLRLAVEEGRVEASIEFAGGYTRYKATYSSDVYGLQEGLKQLIDRVFKEYVDWLWSVHRVREVARRYGYTYKLKYLIRPEHVLTATRSVGGVEVTIEVRVQEGYARVIATARDERGRLDPLLIRGRVGGRVEPVSSRIVTLVEVFPKVEDAAKYGREVLESLSRAVEENLQLIQRRGTRRHGFSEAHYLAFYLLYLRVFHEWINPLVRLGVSFEEVYSTLTRLIRDSMAGGHADADRVLGNYYQLTNLLVEAGFLDLDEDGRILVLGQPLDQLMRDMGFGSNDIAKAYSYLLEDWVRCAVKIHGSIEKALRTKGLVTPAVVESLIKHWKHVPATLLASRWRGRLLAEWLDDTVKGRYAAHIAHREDLETIISDPWLRTAFRAVAGSVIEGAEHCYSSEGRDYSLLLVAVLAYDPETIGTTTYSLVKEGRRPIGVKIGEFIVVPFQYSTQSTEKLFLVFHEKDRIGVAVPARTAAEAVQKAQSIGWDKILNEIWGLQLRGYRITWHRYHGYSYPSVEVYDYYRDVEARLRGYPTGLIVPESSCTRIYVFPGITRLLHEDTDKEGEVEQETS